jgi:hypothetical protein
VVPEVVQVSEVELVSVLALALVSELEVLLPTVELELVLASELELELVLEVVLLPTVELELVLVLLPKVVKDTDCNNLGYNHLDFHMVMVEGKVEGKVVVEEKVEVEKVEMRLNHLHPFLILIYQ